VSLLGLCHVTITSVGREGHPPLIVVWDPIDDVKFWGIDPCGLVAMSSSSGLCEGHDANPGNFHRGDIRAVPLEGDRLLCEECRVWALKRRSETQARARTAQERANAKARGDADKTEPVMRRELVEALERAPRFVKPKPRR
jgi:hypothetical protein